MDDFNITLRALTEGLRELPTDDIARVRHFLAEYLGDARHPVPFGGRARDFARLDSWLLEPAGPAYALLAAPAGRGKSALLLRWCQHLLEQPELAVVYFPVSIRFRTNLAGTVFPALVALLARLHGESIPGDLHTHEEVWHGLLTQYLTRPLPDGRQLLLVLDGIDEAADWEAGSWLLPENPPPHLRVALSARYLANDQDASAWLTRLGWTGEGLAQTVELYPLDRAGIASVLTQMGFPLDLLGTRVDIVSELHRLSEGDPLLIRLYVDDLWERGESATSLTPEDLQAMRPGLPGYFERWWNEQRSLWQRAASEREATVQTVLNLLAGALGPLSQEDILSLAAPDSDLRTEGIEQHLEPLKRFVIGDGMRQGYVFSHPRLASYFLEERLSPAERQEVEQRFLNWGASVLAGLNAGTLAPARVSPYIVQYYGAHLERSQAEVSAFVALVSDGWRQAWEKLDRAYAGFLGDSERAWRAAERANAAALNTGGSAPYLNAEIRSLLCRVSINSMTGNISSRLMLEAVKTGVWTPAQGLASIRLIADLAPRARELAGLAPYVQEPLRTDIAQEALDTIATLKDERERLDMLVEVAPGLPAGLLEQILEIVHVIPDEADRAGVLAELAPTLAQTPELVAHALSIMYEIAEEEYLVLALEGLVAYLSQEQLQEALSRVREIEDDRYRAQALRTLTPLLSSELLQEILAESRAWRVSIPQVYLLAELVKALPEPARAEALHETQELLREILDQEYHVEILLKLAPFLPEEQLQDVLKETQEIWDESYRAHALRELLPSLPVELLPAFLEVVLTHTNEELRVAILLPALPFLPLSLLGECLEHVATIWDEGLRVEMLAQLAALADEHLLPRLLTLAKTIKDPGYRVWLQAELETTLQSETPENIDVAGSFMNVLYVHERVQTLLAIVERVSSKALARIFTNMESEIFGFYRSTLQGQRQAEIVIKLAPRMPEKWLPRAMHLVRNLEWETSQALALIALAPRINEDFLPIALEIVHEMKTRAQRSRVLEALVSTLPAERKAERVHEMLQILQVIKDENDRVSLFNTFIASLTHDFPAESLSDVLAAVREMRALVHKSHMLARLAHIVLPEQFEMLLLDLPMLWGMEARARVLNALIPRLPEQVLPSFLAAVQALHEESWRASVLTTMAEHVSPATFPELLALTLAIRDRNEQTKILGSLATHLPVSAFLSFWEVWQYIQNKGHSLWILNALAEHVPPDYFALVWETAQQIENSSWRMHIIANLAKHASASNFAQIWTMVQQTQDTQQLVSTIKGLLPYIPEALYPQVFETILALLLSANQPDIDAADRQKIIETLEELADYVPASFFLEFWQSIDTLENKLQRADLREKLASRVPESYFVQIWNEVNIVEQDNTRRNQLWEKLLWKLPERFFVQVWDPVKGLEDTWLQGKMLSALAAHVPTDFLAEFWQNVKGLNDPQVQLRILYELAPRLPQEAVREALDMALQFSFGSTVSDWLLWMATFLSSEQSELFLTTLLPTPWTPEDLPDVFTAMREKWPRDSWERLMVALLPRLPQASLEIMLPAFLDVTLRRMQADEDRVAILRKLSANVPPGALPTMLEATWSLQTPHNSQQVLADFMPNLTPAAWLQALELASVKARSTGMTIHLLHVLNAAPVELQQSAPAPLYLALSFILHQLASLPRREALASLTLLEPTLRALGSEEMSVATLCSVLEIGRWWP
ncbi:MAG TPA: hypothetical protein VGD98_08490 [Ktedonobacteraceae bacterium]